MMKKWILSLSLTVGVIGLAACGNNEAVVKTEAGNISKDEFYEALKDKYGEQVLQQLVFEKVLSKEYKVDEKEIDSMVDDLKSEYGAQFEFFLMQNQLKDENELRQTMKLNQLVNKAATKDITISDDELKEYYESKQPKIKVRHILVDDEDIAKEVKAKLDEGGDFAQLANEYSTDTVANESGGDIGFISSDEAGIDPQFRDAAFELEVDEISAPVQSAFGWHIIQVTEKEEKKPFEEMKAELEEELKSSKLDANMIQKH
ncbi:peptidylprolyl isomerase [Bacillus sp. N9]